MSESSKPWLKFICRACGLIYDEELGDPDSGLAPGTRFEDIPDDWECPLCGVTKVDFDPYVKRESVVMHQPVVTVQETGVIVVGAGLAGWSAIEALRALDAEVPITLVTSCAGDLYHKPELSVAVSRGLTRTALVREKASDAAKRLGVRLCCETFVVGITAAQHQLRTTRGTLSYTKLILAQGARPALPDELPANLCWRINDLNSWAALQTQLQEKSQHIAIVGAGMVGCELAEDFSSAGHKVTLLDRQERPLARLLPEQATQRLRQSQEQLGINYLGSIHVTKVKALSNNKKLIETVCGQAIEVDHIVSATGLVTDERLARNSGLTFENGIKVDGKTLQTSKADIYALGDCISIDGQPCRFIEPISRQAKALANALLGKVDEGYCHNQPVIRLKTRSLPIELHGMPVKKGVWRTVSQGKDYLKMEQWFEDHAVSTLLVGKDKAA